MEDGVWRTIGGRRVFIKNGQSVSDAMKESGKFKKKEEKEPEKKDSVVVNNAPDEIADYLYKETGRETITQSEIDDYIDNDFLDDELSDYQPTKEEYEGVYKELEKRGYKIDYDKKNEELKKEIGGDVKKLHKYANEEGILPSELQDRLGIKDSELGLEDDYTKKFEEDIQASQRYIKADEAKRQRQEQTKGNPGGLNSKEDYEHDLEWFEEMEQKYPTGKGLANNEEYQALKEDYESQYGKWYESKEIREEYNALSDGDKEEYDAERNTDHDGHKGQDWTYGMTPKEWKKANDEYTGKLDAISEKERKAIDEVYNQRREGKLDNLEYLEKQQEIHNEWQKEYNKELAKRYPDMMEEALDQHEYPESVRKSIQEGINESPYRKSNYKVGDEVKYEDGVKGKVTDIPTKDRATIEWEDGTKNTYSKNHPGISKENHNETTNDSIKVDTTKLKGEYHTLPERTPEEKASDERYANAKAMYKLTGDEKYKKAYQDEIKASGERIRQQVEAKSNNDKYTDYYKKEHLGEPSNYQKGDKIEFDNGYYDTVKGSIVREATDDEKRYNINSNLKGYIVRDENGFEYVVADTRIKGQGSQTGDPNKVDVSYKRFLNDVVNNKNEGKNYVEWKASQREKAKSTNDTMNDAIREKANGTYQVDTTKLKGTYEKLPERTPEEEASDERYANAKVMYKLTGDEKYKKAYQDEIKATGERIRQQVEAKSNNGDYNDELKAQVKRRIWAEKTLYEQYNNSDRNGKKELTNNFNKELRKQNELEKKYGKISEEDFKKMQSDIYKESEDYKKQQSKTMNDAIRESVNSVKREQAVENVKRGLPNLDDKTAREYVAKLEGTTSKSMNDAIREKARKESNNESNVRKTFDATKEYDFDNNVKNEIEWKNKNKTLLENGYKEETGVDPYKNGKEKTSFKDYQTWRYGIEADKESNESSWSKEFRENKAKNEDEREKNLSNVLRRKAYQKYLREHPGSKITLDEFLKRK